MNGLKRYALVIGNSDYENLETLRTPRNDCTAVGEKLKEQFGFQITSAINKTCNELYSLINTFTKQVNGDLSDIIFYYSGHGCSIQGKNYIIPVDGLDSSETLADRTYISLDDIINSLVLFRHLDNVPIIIILDCCRSESITQSQGHQSNSLVKDDGRHTNIFIMYATGNNQVAFDGTTRNGTFTDLLLTYMDTEEDIETISKNLLKNIHDCGNMQIPWTGSSLLKPYNFRTASKGLDSRNLQSTLLQENSFWPKYPENFCFVDRPEVFKKLDYAIKINEDNHQLRPIVLSGLGGTGKSQIALKFCYRKKDNYRYIFWIDADTETALQSSFLDVAKKLDPPGFVYTKPENIVPQMISWFQNNDGWLLVFDNCDDYSLGFTYESRHLQNIYFPKKGKGVILMTTRNNFAEEDGLVVNLDEMKMDDNTALELLMRKKIDVTDIDPNALEIVKQLGHLPLAIDLTGALMKMEKLTPADFLKKYNENPTDYLDLADIQEQRGGCYGKTVLTVWKVSFDHIRIKNSLAVDLLQSTAFLYPDDIPFALFANHSTMISKTNKTLSSRTLSTAVNLLQSFSLIRRTIRENNIGSSCIKDTLSIHRLVQKVIVLEMGLQEKLQFCGRLISALSNEVPSEILLNNEDSRAIMEVYLPHIRHVVMQFSQLMNEQCSISGELISLLSPTIFYLIRQGLFEDVEYLAKLCLLTSEKHNGELHPDTAAALSKLSYFYVSQNDFKLAELHCLRCLRIRRKIFGPIHKDTVSTYHDLAYIYSSLGMGRHATQLYWEAAIAGNNNAQRTLATRYYKGIGGPAHEQLAKYWENRFLENQFFEEPSCSNDSVRVDLTPLHHAIQQGDIDKIQTQIEHYKQYAAIGDRDGKISLHIAAESGHTDIVKLLLNEFKLDKNVQDNHGWTPLHLAAKNGHITMVKSLMMDFGADACIMNINNEMSAQVAAKNGHFEVMSYIVHETVITNLDLEEYYIGDKGTCILTRGLKQNTILTNLNLSGNNIGGEGACALAEGLKQNIALTNLNLTRNSIGAEGARALAECLKQNTALTNLDLFWNDIDDEGVYALAEALKQNTTLINLDLSNNNIYSKGARALAEGLKQNTALTTLNLELNEIGDEGAHALADGLKQNIILINLDLSQNNIGDDGAYALAEGLKQNTALTNLNLELNIISVDGARALAECLKLKRAITNLNIKRKWGTDEDKLFEVTLPTKKKLRNDSYSSIEFKLKDTKEEMSIMKLDYEGDVIDTAPVIKLNQDTTAIELDISCNDIKISGARILADFLKHNTTLTNLNLHTNSIGDGGARALAEVLKQNTSLTNLNLCNNRIGTEGSHALAECLKLNTTLINLNLEDNSIGDKGACALAEALRQNTVLINLNLCNNNIGDEGSHALAKSLKHNITLVDLNVEGINICNEDILALLLSPKQNTALTVHN